MYYILNTRIEHSDDTNERCDELLRREFVELAATSADCRTTEHAPELPEEKKRIESHDPPGEVREVAGKYRIYIPGKEVRATLLVGLVG